MVPALTPCSATLRVAALDLPTMLHDIIAALVEAQPDMELIGTPPGLDLASWVRQAGVDVLIVQMKSDGVPEGLAGAVREQAHVTVLGVTARGDRAVLYRLAPQVIELGEVSPEGLLAATRTAKGRRTSLG
jgi:hypothetical protein